MKRIIYAVVAAFLFGICVPIVSGQEALFSTHTPVSTPVAAETPVAPRTEPNSAVSTDVDAPSLLDRFDSKDLIIIVLVIALVYQQIRTQNLIPESVVKTVITELRKTTSKTETPLDDAAVTMLESVVKPITAPTPTPDKPPVGFVSMIDPSVTYATVDDVVHLLETAADAIASGKSRKPLA